MNLIAIRNFRNVDCLRLKENGKSTVAGAIHNDQVHKGALFSIGKFKTVDEGCKTDLPNARLIFELIRSGAAAPADDAKLVQRIQTEIAADAQAAATSAANARALTNQANADFIRAIPGSILR